MRNRFVQSTGVLAVALLAAVGLPATAQDPGRPAVDGAFGEPFAEPDIFGTVTDERCIDRGDGSGTVVCKPSAGSIALLPDGDIVYWSALEATENIQLSAVAEFGKVAENDQTRRLDLTAPGGPRWSLPSPVRAETTDNGPRPLVPIVGGALVEEGDRPESADSALFGSDQVFLPNGDLLVASGTDYYTELGAVELDGLEQTRIYEPDTNTWRQVGDMAFGRWYPTMVSLADGRVAIFSGVQKLIKPVYTDGQPVTNSGRNVPQVEVFDPATGVWSLLPDTANRSLPLYPRMRLLPNGEILFANNGQSFNPAGQAFDEALWNVAATFDPETATWTELGVPGLTSGTADVGYRGSTFTTMLPLRPDTDGAYRTVELLSAGGTLQTSPGSYLPVDFSRLTTLDVGGETTTMQTRATATRLDQPRWYGHGTLLPTGEVLVTSGADKDHVIAPGSERAITSAELYDPVTDSWRVVAEQHQPRTYHNSAILLPDATVLVGGHNPIPTSYAAHQGEPVDGVRTDVLGAAPNDGRDPSFEIYQPPYLFRGEQPVITRAPEELVLGETFELRVGKDTGDIASVMLVRHRAETHIIDGDQRTVELQVVERRGKKLTVRMPDSANVVPAGPYMIFVNEQTSDGPIPSKAALARVASSAVRLAIPVAEGSTTDASALATASQEVVDGIGAVGEQVLGSGSLLGADRS